MSDLLNRARRSIQRLIQPVDHRHKDDDFDWRDYTRIYAAEQARSEERFTLALQEGDYRFENPNMIKRCAIKPLHPVVLVTYEALLRLFPSSVIEVGIGGGDHLHNLKLLRPSIQLFGCDISKEQLDFARKRHPELNVPLQTCDITLSGNRLYLPSADIVFTMTVIMHIQTEHSHYTALANLFKHANRQEILMENWSRHDFMDDIRSLFELGELPWEDINFYYHVCDGTEAPHAMIISREPLGQFPELTDYSILRFA